MTSPGVAPDGLRAKVRADLKARGMSTDGYTGDKVLVPLGFTPSMPTIFEESD